MTKNYFKFSMPNPPMFPPPEGFVSRLGAAVQKKLLAEKSPDPHVAECAHRPSAMPAAPYSHAGVTSGVTQWLRDASSAARPTSRCSSAASPGTAAAGVFPSARGGDQCVHAWRSSNLLFLCQGCWFLDVLPPGREEGGL